MNFIKKIINYFKVKKVRKELESYNDKYASIVDKEWEKKGFSKEADCFERHLLPKVHVCAVSLVKGIDLVLANNEENKRINLCFSSKKVGDLVKLYIRLKGYSDSNVVLGLNSN